MIQFFKDRWRFILPNLLTFMASLSALAAIYIAYKYRDKSFGYLILFSGLMDMLDGPLARRLKAKSQFGNIFDSMSDFLAFGLAPAMSFVFLGLLHPLIAAVYILAIQFRLTRYSALPESPIPEKFFQGVSAPDCVYLSIFIGLLPFSSYHVGFLIMSLLAIYPGKLYPKGYRILKLVVAIGALMLFIFIG